MPDLVLTGLPRSGSTLTCHLLKRCPDTVALHEPLLMGSLSREHSPDSLVGEISRFFTDTRRSLLQDRRAASKVIDGRVPDNTFGEARGTGDNLRKSLAEHGEASFEDKLLTPDFTLAVKHNAGFTALLDRLAGTYPCYGIVRHPLAVLSSWNSVKLSVQQGHVPVGEQIDAGLRDALARIDDRTERQFYILEWFFERFLRLLGKDSVLRYEELIASRGRSLAVVTPSAAALDEPLASKNVNTAYDAATMQELGRKLLGRSGAFWELYTKESVEEMIAAPSADH